ncbi:transcriptional regulator, TetR family [Leifsonia xyli subsp. xyli str. CTCB07]|uniref:Transcriptional regulator, TetR family n=1 Tax=Leifsonia xyli subsp. xyli (strain CTCB07) TaxID=281090 RepID=Q6AD67_LEIXX|nr:transcriptional regulator, TetR family [Leifsonia xyli subsp. xyli str. CTCB07]
MMAGARDTARRETETRVLAASDALFRERGFADTTIRDIAAAAGVSAGTVIAVGDKSGLLVAIFDRLIEAEHRKRSCALSTGSALDRIVALQESFVDVFADRAELARAYASILVAGSHASTVFTQLAATLITEFREVLGPGSDALARALHRAYLGTLFLWAASGSDDAVALKEDLRNTMSALCPPDKENP